MAAYRWVDDLTVTCGLTACTPGSAPGRALGIEYGKPLPLSFYKCMEITYSDTCSEIIGLCFMQRLLNICIFNKLWFLLKARFVSCQNVCSFLTVKPNSMPFAVF